MKASLLKTIRNPEGENRRSRINYKIITFLVCIVISFFLWLMNMLGKKYTDTLTFHVQYLHLPQDKKLYPSTETVNLKVSTSGFNIAAYTFGIKDPFLNIDAAQFRHKENQYLYSLDNKSHMEKIEEQLGDQMKVVDAAPDTLYLRSTQN
jgi:hypothetical protein